MAGIPGVDAPAPITRPTNTSVTSMLPEKSYNAPTIPQQPIASKGRIRAIKGNAMLSGLFQQGVDQLTSGMFGDSTVGQNIANVFSSGLGSAGNTIFNNLAKGQTFADGLGKNALSSMGNAVVGIGANLVGQGITGIMGNSKLGKFTGQFAATGLANAKAISNAAKTISDFNKASKAGKATADMTKGFNLAKGNLVGIGMSALGSGLSAAFGSGKTYEGEYGGLSQGIDAAYDTIQGAVGFVPGAGTVISGAMALNKGLSHVFGSTSGETLQDVLMDKVFLTNWANMAGAKTTDTFGNQSWQNTERTNNFMGDAFGNLGDRFETARNKAGKTFGTFSRGAYNQEQANIRFANQAYDRVLAMADQADLGDIKGQKMTSVNNQRYSQNIGGGYNSVYRGKEGMKILSNASVNEAKILSNAAFKVKEHN